MFSLFIDLMFLVGLVLAAGLFRTWMMQQDPRNQLFAKGTVPKSLPDGVYSGTAQGYKGSWRGKKFHSEKMTGINVFDQEGKTVEKYPFRTSVGHGLMDQLEVIKIDYNLPENPIWLRGVLDEIVEVEKNQFLGKLHLRVIPGLAFTLAFFELKKLKAI